MTRVATSNYAGSSDTSFEWATAGSDRFSRELDLYRLARALELHDHSAGKGLAVSRVANGSIATAALAAGAVDATKLGTDAVTAVAVALDAIGALELANNAVDTNAIANLAVTAAKLAVGAAVSNIGYTPLNRAGDTITGHLNFDSGIKARFATENLASKIDLANNGEYLIGIDSAILRLTTNRYVQFWNVAAGGASFIYDTTNHVLTLNGNAVWHAGNLTAPTATPTAGRIPIADGSGKLDGWITSAVGVPSGHGGWVPTAAAIPSGYTRYSNLDGRIPVGAGAAGGISNAVTYIENTNYGSDTQHSHTISHAHGLNAHTHNQGDTGAAQGGSLYDEDDTGNGWNTRDAAHFHGGGVTQGPNTGSTGGSDTSSSANTQWAIPSRAVVWMTKN